jgi:MFS transporter, DHA1 family, multidrug resistance protein
VNAEIEPGRKLLLLRLSAIVFFAELAHGMLLYGIIPDLVQNRFPPTGKLLFGFLPVREEVAGLCVAAYTVAELLFKVQAGHRVDQRGPDGIMRVGLFLSLATVPIILLSKSPEVMLIGSFLHGVGAAPVWPAVISSWTRGRSAEERGAIMGQILTGWMAGLGIGVIAGKFLVALSGRAELAATCAPLLMWGITVFAALYGPRLGYAASHGMENGEAQPSRFPPELRIMGIGLFLQNTAFGALIMPFNFLTEQKFGLTTAQVGLLFLLGGGPAVFLLGPMGKVADRLGRRSSVIRSMLVVSPLIATGPFLAYLPVDPWVRFALIIPGLMVAGTAYALMLPAWHGLALGRIPENQRGRSLALLMSIEMAALALGHVIGTPLYTKVHFAAPFVIAGVVFGTLAILYALGHILPPEGPAGPPHTVDLQLSSNGAGSQGGAPAKGAPSPSAHSGE